MAKLNAYNLWIEAGYVQFANEGLEGIQVERLARIISLNKSGYYHYFADREGFIEHLMKYHVRKAEQIANEIRSITKFDPDFIAVLIKYPVTIMVQMQLIRNRNNQLLNEVYTNINAKLDPAVAPSWAAFIGIPDNLEIAQRYF